jgi:hypothetical protein
MKTFLLIFALIGVQSSAFASTALLSHTSYGPPSPQQSMQLCSIFLDHVDHVSMSGTTVTYSTTTNSVVWTNDVTAANVNSLISIALASPLQINNTIAPAGCGEVTDAAEGKILSTSCGGTVREMNSGASTNALINLIQANCQPSMSAN